ncbi:flavohemo protein [Mytilinidion resinicola]|uniref:nitric oxide dioxygenase n=1 Tax=Mytilinidion resinicola TaxID=574789 RepID=A0A6A6YUZ8_9PEZI|nr:flavohemo protein [Mytilinidion resinicola]KAF2812349.1 flavohemo protein [Mytilinidion resinicola]
MAPPLTPSQTAIIKSTAPLLATHGTTITTHFYTTLLAAHPPLRSIFSATHQATGAQPRALAGALLAYATHIDDLGALSPTLALICAKHASLGITPAQYGVVGTGLLAALEDVLTPAVFTAEVKDAWAAAYWQLADIMIAAEAELYAQAAWQGWREFRVARKEVESAEITSFYLEPVDGGKLPRYKPGQYVSVQVPVPQLGEGVLQARQYSLSDAPGKGYFRISVKRESGLVSAAAGPGVEKGQPGWVSNILHAEKAVGDVVGVAHPYGDFYLEVEGEGPVVLISGGVGLTSLMAMLNALVERKSGRKVAWIHAARNASVRGFRGHVEEVEKTADNVHAVLFDTLGGRMDLGALDREKDLFLGDERAEYFICGPEGFMVDVETKLKAYGVDAGRIKMELFGTGGVPRGLEKL